MAITFNRKSEKSPVIPGATAAQATITGCGEHTSERSGKTTIRWSFKVDDPEIGFAFMDSYQGIEAESRSQNPKWFAKFGFVADADGNFNVSDEDIAEHIVGRAVLLKYTSDPDADFPYRVKDFTLAE